MNNGNYSAAVNVCDTGNHNVLVMAFDIANSKQSDSVKLVVNTTTPATVPLNTCQVVIDQYVNYKVDAVDNNLIYPADSITYFSQNNSDIFYAVSRTKPDKLSMSFQKVTATGTVPFSQGIVYVNGTGYMTNGITTVTISEYKPTASGTYVTGMFTGNVSADSGRTLHPLVLTFRAKK